MGPKHTVVLVPETHWDREWYSTFEQFRYRLVKLTDKLLDILDTDERFRRYVFDGQTIVLEDYLEIRPENRGRLEEHVRSGRLLIGPWYVLPDEWLVSGESLVRNLLIGHRIAAEFGRVMKAGYIPDPFGHTAQLPQILAGFGISSAYFMRGVGEEWDGNTVEFDWAAPDGTSVMAVFLRNSYCNARNLGYVVEDGITRVDMETALEQVRAQVDTLAPLGATQYVLLNNGCDHLEPQPELPDIIDYLNEHLDDVEVRHSDYEEYEALVRAENPELATLSGEWHWGKYQLLLPNVFSTRVYLKQANQQCESLLEKYAEPLAALAWANGADYDAEFLLQAWKLLISNHPHDSICGCSVDAVHREMVSRFERADQVGELIRDKALGHLTGKLDLPRPGFVDDDAAYARSLVVFNPLNFRRREAVSVHQRVPWRLHELPPELGVYDAEGKPLPTQVTNSSVGEYQSGEDPTRPTWDFDLLVEADVPPLGFATYTVASHARPEREPFALVVEPDVLANGFLEVMVSQHGSLVINDLVTNEVFLDLNLYEDTEDIGDEYNYSPAPQSWTLTTTGLHAEISVVEIGPVRGTLKIEQVWHLPRCIDPSRLSRSEDTVPCRLVTFVSLQAGSRRVDITTHFDNQAKDHRLRALFPTDCDAETCAAETHFHVIEREIALPDGEGWREEPTPTKATSGFVDVSDGDRGLAVANVGLPEYEVLGRPDGAVIAQTLLRSVGWLSREDLLTRPCNAGPRVETPEAQCLGPHTFRYAIIPHSDTWDEARIWQEAHALRYPLVGRTVGFHQGELQTDDLCMFELEPQELVVSALKKAEREDALVLRLYNISREDVIGRLVSRRPLAAARLANLNEEPLPNGSLEISDQHGIEFPARPSQIVTLLLELG